MQATNAALWTGGHLCRVSHVNLRMRPIRLVPLVMLARLIAC